MSNIFSKILSVLLLLVIILFPSFVYAQGVCSKQLVPCRGMCSLCQIFELFSNLINFFVFCLTPPIAGLMIVLSGLILIFGGSEGAKTTGKKMLTSTLIALLIIYASWLIVNTIIQEVAPGGTGGTWYNYQCADGGFRQGQD